MRLCRMRSCMHSQTDKITNEDNSKEIIEESVKDINAVSSRILFIYNVLNRCNRLMKYIIYIFNI